MDEKLFKDREGFYKWEQSAIDCDREIRQSLSVIFEKWTERGYSPREIAYIAFNSIIEINSYHVMQIVINRKKIKK